MNSSIFKAVSVTCAVFLSAAAWGDLESVVENCNGCHGDDGVSQWTDVPTIAGMPEFVHSDQLYMYQDGDRPCDDTEYRQGDTSRPATNMCDVASGISDDMKDEVAAYYFAKPFVAAKQEFNAGLALEGKAVHEEHCDRCHSEGGMNPDDEAGILGGQWMGYMEHAFAEYRADERDQPAQMKEKIDALSDADVTALLHYYASEQ
jgi:sulfide dehydrogenase cytochrome subunit